MFLKHEVLAILCFWCHPFKFHENGVKTAQTGFEIPITTRTSVTQHIMLIHAMLKWDNFHKGR